MATGVLTMKTFLATTLCLFVCQRLNLVCGDDTPKVLPSEYNALLSKIAALETRVSTAENKVQTVNSDSASVAALQSKVSTLETLVGSLQSQLQSHQSQMNSQQGTIASLISQISRNSDTIGQNGKSITALTSDLDNEKSKVATLQNKLESLETKTANATNVLFDNVADLSIRLSKNFSNVHSSISSINTTLGFQQKDILDDKAYLDVLAVNVTYNRNGLLELTNEFRNHTVSALKESTAFHTQVLRVQEKQHDLEAEMKSHQSSITLHNNMLIAQMNKTNRVNGRLDGLERNVSDQSQRLLTQGNSISSMQSSLTRLAEIQNKSVAFFARLPDEAVTLHQGSTIVFSRVITNKGQAFSGNTGVFTCNVKGIYVFHINLVTVENDFIVCGIMKNGNAVSYVEAVGNTLFDATGYNTVVLDLQIGDRVWIEDQHINGSKTSLSIPQYLIRFVTFSGYLAD